MGRATDGPAGGRAGGVTVTDLPPAQARALAAVREYWAEHGGPPSVRDVARAVGSPHPNAAAGLLARLAARGLIEWARTGAARGIWPAGLRDRIRGLVGDHS